MFMPFSLLKTQEMLSGSLMELARVPADLVFVFPQNEANGREWECVSDAGFKCQKARGSGVLASLALLSQSGHIDAILTEDSCVFALGVKLVLILNAGQDSDTCVVVDIYDTMRIERELRLTRGGFILYAFLVGIDWEDEINIDTFRLEAHGTPGIPPGDGFRVAQTRVADAFFERYQQLYLEAGSGEELEGYLRDFRKSVIHELKYTLRIFSVARRLEQAKVFPSMYSRD
ncbi:hypothetical protein V5O48_019217, partial [Marasmius crinis-equi]